MIAIIVITEIGLALIFEFLSGFHNTGNVCASLKYTKVCPVWVAVIGCAILNTAGGLAVGTSVAIFVTKIVPLSVVNDSVLISLLIAASFWNLATWWAAMPVASSHCLLSALMGAGLAAAGGLSGINLPAVVTTLEWFVLTPLIGFLFCHILAAELHRWCGSEDAPRNARLRRALPAWQILSAGLVSFAEGANNAQKVEGLLILILAIHYGTSIHEVPQWVVLVASVTIGLGTLAGGLGCVRIMKTFGEGFSKRGINQVEGTGAQFTSALVVLGASLIGVPASTAQTQVGSTIGATCGVHGVCALQWKVVSRVLLGWILTWVAPSTVAAALYFGLQTIAG
jgi:PiT family inorganic phosphate transporter